MSAKEQSELEDLIRRLGAAAVRAAVAGGWPVESVSVLITPASDREDLIVTSSVSSAGPAGSPALPE